MKKILSFALAVICAVCCMSPITSALDAASIPKEQLGLLEAIGFMNEDGFAEDAALTRAEFCSMICSIFKYEPDPEAELPFRDIDKTHPYYGSIATLYQKGAVKGISKYAMAPNKTITLGEAGVIAVTALGYDKLAEINGGKYYSQGAALGLFDGIAGGENEALSEDAAVKMMYNILFAPIMSYEPYGNEISYSMDKDLLMMNKIYDMYEVKGTVRENDTASLYGESSLGKGEVKIDDEVYVSENEEIHGLLGYSVKAYIIDIDRADDKSVIYAYKDKKNEELEISSEDIEDASKTLIEYTSGTKTLKAKLSKAADVVYNGLGKESYDATLLKPVYGGIKLIDNDGDGNYDVAFVTDYKLAVVSSTANTDKKIGIYDKYGNDFEAETDIEKCNVFVWVKNEAADIKEITSGSVVLIADSGLCGGSRVINIFICSDKVTGVLKNVNDETITIDSAVIDYSPLMNVSEIRSGASKTVTCYKDIFGKAVYVTIGSEGNYGYLFKAAFLDDAVEEAVQVKILTTDNEWKTYRLREKIRCNDTSWNAVDFYNESDLTKKTLDDATGKETVSGTKKQLVRYSVNENGEINRLDLAEDSYDSITHEDALREKGTFRKSMDKRNRRFAHQNSGLFKGQGYSNWLDCFFPGNLPVLVVPDSNDISEDDVLFYAKSYFKTDKDYVTEGFDRTEDNYISAVIVYGSAAATIEPGNRFVVVDYITDEINEDDEVVKVLYAWSNGALTAFEAKNENSFKINGEEVKRGDIVRVAKNFSGKAESLENKYHFRIENYSDYFTDVTDLGENVSYDGYAYNQMVKGTVSKIYGNYMRVKVKDDQYINVQLRTAGDAYYYLYDASNYKNPISAAKQTDITVGSVVAAKLYFGKLYDLVIYKF